MVFIALTSLMACAVFAAEVAPGVEVHGYAQNRFYDAPGTNAEFRTERLSLSTTAKFANGNTAYAEVYYNPWTSNAQGLYLESAYYDASVGSGRLRVGKGRRITFGLVPSYPNRKTSNYGIVAESITQDRVQGVQYTLDRGPFNVGLSAHTGYRIGYRNIGDVPGDNTRDVFHDVPHLAWRDPLSGSGTPTELNRYLQLAGRVGWTYKNMLNVGFSSSAGSLDPRDLANLNGTVPAATNPLLPVNPLTAKPATTPIGPGFTSQALNEWGPDVELRLKNGLVFQGEYYLANVSNLPYSVWDVLAGYEAKNGWKVITRYAQQNMNIAKTDNPLTWNDTQLSLSIMQPLTKSTWIQYEYELNGTTTNTSTRPSNNLFFVELFTGF